MKQIAHGFYWTLPVPWAGFTNLSTDVDTAAMQSRTIRYQCERVRRHARDNALSMAHEEVFLALDPDRVAVTMAAPLETAVRRAEKANAVLLVVDFAAEKGWRANPYLRQMERQFGGRITILSPDAFVSDGFSFDPASHFSDWRAAQKDWSSSKQERIAQVLDVTRGLQRDGLSYPLCAAVLNQRNIPNLTGKLWTGTNLRKFMDKYSG